MNPDMLAVAKSVLGVAISQSGIFASWLGWSLMAGAVAGWLSFLYVPLFQQIGGPLWRLSLVLLGVQVLQLRGS